MQTTMIITIIMIMARASGGRRLRLFGRRLGAAVGLVRAPAPSLWPPKRGVRKPTVYRFPQFPLSKNMPSCLGQWCFSLNYVFNDNRGKIQESINCRFTNPPFWLYRPLFARRAFCFFSCSLFFARRASTDLFLLPAAAYGAGPCRRRRRADRRVDAPPIIC